MSSPTTVGSRHEYYRLTAFEVATSWVHGQVQDPLRGRGRARETPRQALEAILLRPILAGPCYVAFSGGRDSSAVLAVATHLARRHGVPDPVPVTERYPGLPEADEARWQHLVVDHLKLREWHTIELDETHDLLGPGARASLARRGLLWPAALHLKTRVLAEIGGGSFLTGEGGDEVFGDRRVARVRHVRDRGRRPTLAESRSAATALAPEVVRRWRIRTRLERDSFQPWVRSEILRVHHQLLATDAASEPIDASASIRWLLRRRASAVSAHNYARLASEYGLDLVQPLLAPQFVHALAAAAGTWGYASRTEAMRHLCHDLLPDEILARTSKAYFNRAFVGAGARGFARTWDGSGVDTDMVDPGRLRSEWLSDFPSALSTTLLHAAWLGHTTERTGS
ncbi:hypothetical protein GCM10009868_16240 [Terrabacter aerolatus]|uniref:Asparagine synthetase domain-containing protein n=1 Tax=Terrabacter aerolatus TaxID=422442 RepID=A0A512D3P4_9MICO|nr:asparagine synthase C-terminal domain-containing protein [Terrabacter aerolatus]GEO31074.1 hypothetical protein TAE01_28840 [Terrabacter aerolatus]